MAITDQLTGLRNRRYFEAHLHIETARSLRSGKPMSLILFDIDYFKSVNDGYGHPAGDRVLVEMATRLSREVRGEDVLARYGGEEFAVLLSGANPENAEDVACRIMAAINDAPFSPAHGLELQITASAGTVTFPDHARTPTELISGADRALYAAKRAGRARLVVGRLDPLPTFLRRGQVDPVVDYLEALADRVDTYQAPVEHGSAIARWAVAMATELGFDEATQQRCNLAGRLHDIGKLAVPMQTLTKAGPLDSEDLEYLHDHPGQGEMIVACAPGLRDVAEVIGQHHERVDGTGYPRGLREGQIRVESKILSVCDTFASMRADRPHRRALTQDEAVARLIDARGCQLSTELVDLFLELLERQVVGSLGLLTNTFSAPPASRQLPTGLLVPLAPLPLTPAASAR